MRLQKVQPNSFEYEELDRFSNWILDIGYGRTKNNDAHDEENDKDSSVVEIPEDLLLCTTGNKIDGLVRFVFPDFENKYNDADYLKERAILSTTNDIVDEINDYVLSLVPNIEREYFSADTISNCVDTCNDADILYPIEYLNTLNANNFPSHKLKLKIGTPVMLLRNLNQSLGLCNGTRLIVANLADNIIEAIIIHGTHIGEITINLTTRGNHWPFTLCRRQFPMKVCYCMTINKSQGQTLSRVGLYLRKPVFTHGQLYVAISRVTKTNGLKILIENQDGACGTTTTNIVYKEIIQMV
jgi:ATP-dependent DNA helicase PIF1